MKTDTDVTWVISPHVRSTYSEDGAVLLDISKGLCYSLNPVAARVWSVVEGSTSGIDLSGLTDALETHYQVSRQVLEQDVADYLFNLEQKGLVHRNGCYQRARPILRRG